MMNLIHLTDRSILSLSSPKGKEAVKNFLQGVITQDIRKLSENNSLYAAHLTPQGKFLYDFFIVEKSKEIFIDCHKKELIEIAKSFHKYDLNREIEFEDLSDEKSVYAVPLPSQETEGFTTHSNDKITWTDPRIKDMGTRIISSDKIKTTDSLENYHAQRISLGLPDGAYDGLKERTLINEMYFENLNGVDFKKGCYVGQELTARTKFRTEPKKRLVHLTFSQDVTYENGESLKKEGIEAGWAFSHNKKQGIGIIRTRYWQEGENLTLNGIDVALTPPKWVKTP